jgi:hypothetical protein
MYTEHILLQWCILLSVFHEVVIAVATASSISDSGGINSIADLTLPATMRMHTLHVLLHTQQAQTVNATVNFELTKALRSASGGDGYDGYDEDLVDTPRSGDAPAAAATASAAANNSLDSSNSLFSDDPPLFSDDNSEHSDHDGSSLEYSASAGPARHAAMAASESATAAAAAAAAVLELSSSEHDGDEAVGEERAGAERSAVAGGDWTKTVDTDISLPEDFESRADEHEREAQ